MKYLDIFFFFFLQLEFSVFLFLLVFFFSIFVIFSPDELNLVNKPTERIWSILFLKIFDRLITR